MLPWLERATNCVTTAKSGEWTGNRAREKVSIRYPEMRGQKLEDDRRFLYTLRYWSFAAIDELACVSRHFLTDRKSLNQNPACREKEKEKILFAAQHSAMMLTHFPDAPNGFQQILVISTHHGHVPAARVPNSSIKTHTAKKCSKRMRGIIGMNTREREVGRGTRAELRLRGGMM